MGPGDRRRIPEPSDPLGAAPRRRSRPPEASRSALVEAPVSAVYDAFADDQRRGRWLRGQQPEVQSAIRDRTVNLRWPTGERAVVVVTPVAGGGTRVTVRTQLGPDDSVKDVRARWDQELLLLQSWLRKQV